MASITIRNLDDDVKTRLRVRVVIDTNVASELTPSTDGRSGGLDRPALCAGHVSRVCRSDPFMTAACGAVTPLEGSRTCLRRGWCPRGVPG